MNSNAAEILAVAWLDGVSSGHLLNLNNQKGDKFSACDTLRFPVGQVADI